MRDASWTGDSLRYLLPRGDRRRDAWAEEAAEGNRRGGQRLLDAGEVEPPAPVAQALRLGEGERAVSRRRLVLLDDVPIEIATSYYPARIAGGTPLAERRKVPGGAVTFLAELGWVAHRVEETVTARMPDAEERELLALPDAEPVMVLFRVVLAKGDQPVEVCVMTMAARDRALRYRLDLG